MLSAVENLGSGRVYPHPFPGATAPSSLLGQLPLSAAGLPLLGPGLVDMSVAEFARPHPKQQSYNESTRNGLLSSSRTKYADPPPSPQSGPVNLAVSPNLPNSHSAAQLSHLSHEYHERTLQAAHAAQARAAHAHAQQQQQQQQQRHQEQQQKEAVAAAAAAAAASDIGKLYSPTNSRLAFFPSSLDTSSYPGLNYGMYPFGYSPAHLDTRMLGRPTYLPGQRDPYTPTSFLTPASFASAESAKSKLYPPVSLSHLNGHSGLKPTSLQQLPQDNKLHPEDRSPTMPPSSSATSLISAYSDRDRPSYHLNGLTGLADHPLPSKYQSSSSHGAVAPSSDKDPPIKLEHKQQQHHSSHHTQQHPPPGSVPVSIGGSSGGHHHQHHHQFTPPSPLSGSASLPPQSLPPPSSSSSSSQQQQQRHRSMPSHPHSLAPHLHSTMTSDGGGPPLMMSSLDNEFKVPSGKEGSLKHRILTRPASDRGDTRRRSPPMKSTTIFRPFENGSVTNFSKGALIQLAGECKRVEDVRTEDLVQTAEKSPDLRLAESTTVKITPRNHIVIITFSYDNNRSRVDIEATIEHPFFVYGQGWASCNPEKSMQQFGLRCQKLQVGDICLSLIPREKAPKMNHSSSTSSATSMYLTSSSTSQVPSVASSQQQQLYLSSAQSQHPLLNVPPPAGSSQSAVLQHQHQQRLYYNMQQNTVPMTTDHHQSSRTSREIKSGEPGSSPQHQYLPQNLSRKASSHVPSSTSATTPSNPSTGSGGSSSQQPYGSFPPVPHPVFSMPFSAAHLSKPHDPTSGSHHPLYPPPKPSPDQSHHVMGASPRSSAENNSNEQPVPMVVDKHHHHSHHSSSSSSSTSSSSGVGSLSSSSSSSSSSKSGSCTSTSSLSPLKPPGERGNDLTILDDVDEDCVIDASVSRKRRWSAPDSCDEETKDSKLQTTTTNSTQPPPIKIPQII
ncbi:ataxin-1 [Uranotaenia lowii]|uniref:ataxin-1 n=1 Tax=Uranotaenia lowii TaxID=190385 RepID=UPI00247A1D43|nr:ataxin-1 [Uranotaenia lowii]XP_055597895.1 ataxin-1 [Uranotaenia lowii]XP_055597904.1 ataxin-1 [Uranotaenia lowii]